MYGLIERNYKKFPRITYSITLSISQCFSFKQLIARQAPTAFHTEKSKVAFSPIEVNIAKPKRSATAESIAVLTANLKKSLMYFVIIKEVIIDFKYLVQGDPKRCHYR